MGNYYKIKTKYCFKMNVKNEVFLIWFLSIKGALPRFW